MAKVLNINSEITTGKHKGKVVKDIISENKKEIFSLIKDGMLFDDEVLSMAGIKKNIRNVKVTQVFTKHEKDDKVYEKDKESLSKILKEIRTIDNLSEMVLPESPSDLNSNEEYDEINVDEL